MEDKSVKRVMKVTLPSIKTNKKVHVTREKPSFTLEFIMEQI